MGTNKKSINISNINIEWDSKKGTCLFEKHPVAMMWVDTTLAGLMAGVQSMVGTERFMLALQGEGRKSVEADWEVISKYPDFSDGFNAISVIAAVAGWGNWEILSLDLENSECVFRIKDSWEGKYQKTLDVCWGSGMLAGKMAGYCSKLFGQNCWAKQTSYAAKGEEYDIFHVKPSDKTLENEIDNLLISDEATKADMAVALQKLQIEIQARTQAEEKLLKSQQELEIRVLEKTRELKESELKFRALFEQAGDYIIVLEQQPDGPPVIVDANQAAIDKHGFTRDEFIGMAISDVDVDLNKDVMEERVKQLLAGKHLLFEMTHRKKDGSHFFAEASVKLLDMPGKLPLIISIERDITERKKSEEATRKIQSFNETILAATPEVIYVYDIINRINIYSNDGVKRVLGYTTSEVKEMGENLIETLMHPDDFPSYINNILPRYRISRDNEIIEHEYRMRHKSGQWCWLHSKESVFSRQEDGTPEQIFGIISDITQQKYDKERIIISETEYRSLFNTMLDGFALHEIICDDDGSPVDYRFLKINSAFEKLTGLKAKNLVGKTVLEALPGTEKHWIDTYGQVALTGEPILFENFSVELDKYFKVTAYCPTKNQFVCIFQDITLRKKAEEEKDNLESQLRQSHKMEAIGTMAGGIAHDFNNILAAILGYADLAKSDISVSSPANESIEQIKKAGHRATELVRHILTFSRMGNTFAGHVPINLSSIVKEVLKFQRSVIPTTISIIPNIDESCGEINGDPTQIHQVVMNFCSNASHAMEEIGGTIKVDLQKVVLSSNDLVKEPNRSPGSYLMLSVSDTGTGLDSELIDKIFDPYFTTKEVGKGSGLGLSVVQGIMKSHGGLVKVDSELGKGSTFSVFFPMIKSETVEVDIETDEDIPTGTEKILFVDDERVLADLGKSILEKLSYSVTAMTDSTEALDLFKSAPSQFDLVITDQTMPNISGSKLASQLLQVRPDIPIILCTGHSDTINEIKAQEIGIKEYTMKPVSKKDIAQLIRKVLDTA